MLREGAVRLVSACLLGVLSQKDNQNIVQVDHATALVGRHAVVDSIGLVELISDLEQTLEQEHGLVLRLADERAFAHEPMPFRSVGTLADYICHLAVEVEQGTIFNDDTLKLIHEATQGVDNLPSVNHNLVASLPHRTARKVFLSPEGSFVSQPYYDPQKPARAAAELEKVREAVSRAGHRIHVTGNPVLTGWVYTYLNQILAIRAWTLALLASLLIVYFRRLYGIALPLLGAYALGLRNILAITGASGSVFGIRTLEHLARKAKVHLIISSQSFEIISHETGIDWSGKTDGEIEKKIRDSLRSENVYYHTSTISPLPFRAAPSSPTACSLCPAR